MKLLGKSKSSEPEQVRRVTGRPDTEAAPEMTGDHSPVEGRMARLGKVAQGAVRGRTDLGVRKVMQILGMFTIAFGFGCIVLGWYGASHSPYQIQEIPYLISGGLLGVALVFGGGVLIRYASSLRQIEETRLNTEEARRNTLAIVRSLDRLERSVRETRTTQFDGEGSQ
jgi:hypothetical protein